MTPASSLVLGPSFPPYPTEDLGLAKGVTRVLIRSDLTDALDVAPLSHDQLYALRWGPRGGLRPEIRRSTCGEIRRRLHDAGYLHNPAVLSVRTPPPGTVPIKWTPTFFGKSREFPRVGFVRPEIAVGWDWVHEQGLVPGSGIQIDDDAVRQKFKLLRYSVAQPSSDECTVLALFSYLHLDIQALADIIRG